MCFVDGAANEFYLLRSKIVREEESRFGPAKLRNKILLPSSQHLSRWLHVLTPQANYQSNGGYSFSSKPKVIPSCQGAPAPLCQLVASHFI
eukprot:m.92491 g.92491  ORF g.92491 m.92491 type:complete len:91 (-) comp21722_c0_seq1:42-314(-)